MPRADFDVAVMGGGSAGLAAAVTAARQGAKTLLIERYGFLGGMGTASLVHTFCGLYLLRDEPGAVLANEGFPAEMAARMIAATGLGPIRMGRVDVLPQHPTAFVQIADAMVAAESALELRLHTEVVSLARDSGGWEIGVAGRGGARNLFAAALVDASGDAAAAGFLGGGAEMTAAPRLQRPAYVFAVQREKALDDQARLATAGILAEAIRAGDLPASAIGISFRASSRAGEIFATLDLAGDEAGADYDPLDAACLTRLEMTGRNVGTQVVAWLQAKSSDWRDAYIRQWPIRAGVRESRRWLGEYVLSGAELLAGTRFSDEIALATWPMEFRESPRGPKLRFPEGNRPTGIPLRALKPAGIDRLFVAGRCISTDHDAQASVRVMGTCFATGAAAGRAAALRSAGSE